jgi:hypothetical protein
LCSVRESTGNRFDSPDLGESAPGNHHGVDITAAGEGVIVEERLYQLVRQQGAVAERTFKIRFLDPGVEVFAFTFG